MKKLLSLLMALTLISGCVSGLSLTANAKGTEPTETVTVTYNYSTEWTVSTIEAGTQIYNYGTVHNTTSNFQYKQTELDKFPELYGAVAVQTDRKTDGTTGNDYYTAYTKDEKTEWARISINNSAYIYVLVAGAELKWLATDGYKLVEDSDGVALKLNLHKTSTGPNYTYSVYKKEINLKDGETSEISFKSLGVSGKNPYTIAVKWINNYEDSDLVSSHNEVFKSSESFELDNGETYEGPSGVVFATAVETLGGLNRTEFGVAISEEELTADEFKTSKNVEFAKADDNKITANYKYGVRFFGSRVKAGKTFYTLPYAKYTDSLGKEITVFGSEVLNFTPNAQ